MRWSLTTSATNGAAYRVRQGNRPGKGSRPIGRRSGRGSGPRGPRGGRDGPAIPPIEREGRRLVGSVGHGLSTAFGTPYPDSGRDPIQPPVSARPSLSSTKKPGVGDYLAVVTINPLNELSD